MRSSNAFNFSVIELRLAFWKVGVLSSNIAPFYHAPLADGGHGCNRTILILITPSDGRIINEARK